MNPAPYRFVFGTGGGLFPLTFNFFAPLSVLFLSNNFTFFSWYSVKFYYIGKIIFNYFEYIIIGTTCARLKMHIGNNSFTYGESNEKTTFSLPTRVTDLFF
jgi:hypothetical protein